MRRTAHALVLAAAVAGALNLVRGVAAAGSAQQAVLAKIVQYRSETWHWQRLMGVRLARPAPGDPLRALGLWQRRAGYYRQLALHPPHLRDWLCIHRYEGSWTDAGGPYYGGLQMDISFQRHYGAYLLRAKGTANHWTPLEQMWVAERARRSGRGFYPWPNTARYCGLM